MPTVTVPRDRPHLTPGALLDEADALREAGHSLAAGCLVRAALEATLRDLCERHRCTPSMAAKVPPYAVPRTNRYVRALWRRRIIDRRTGNRIKKALEKTNGPAHGRPMSADSAARWIAVARDLLARSEGRAAA
jgi:hypothetical protein